MVTLRCCGGWKYLQAGFSRLHRPCNESDFKSPFRFKDQCGWCWDELLCLDFNRRGSDRSTVHLLIMDIFLIFNPGKKRDVSEQ